MGSSGLAVLVFLRPQVPGDAAIFKAIRSIAKDNKENKQLRMLLINPDMFMELVPQWEHVYGVDLRYAALGILNHAEGSSVWFNSTDIQTSICTECIGQQVTAWLEQNLPGFTYAGGDEEEEEEEEQQENMGNNEQQQQNEESNGTTHLEAAHNTNSWVSSLFNDRNQATQSSFILGVSAGKINAKAPSQPSEEDFVEEDDDATVEEIFEDSEAAEAEYEEPSEEEEEEEETVEDEEEAAVEEEEEEETEEEAGPEDEETAEEEEEIIGEEEEEVVDEEIVEEEEVVEEEVPQMSAGAQEMAKKFSRES